jgi:hypothetical protein
MANPNASLNVEVGKEVDEVLTTEYNIAFELAFEDTKKTLNNYEKLMDQGLPEHILEQTNMYYKACVSHMVCVINRSECSHGIFKCRNHSLKF